MDGLDRGKEWEVWNTVVDMGNGIMNREAVLVFPWAVCACFGAVFRTDRKSVV